MQEEISETSRESDTQRRATSRPGKWTLTQEAFDKLLQSLDADRELAGQKYQDTRNNLTRFFEWRGCPFPEDHADETINRVAKKISQGVEVRELTKYFFGVARLLFLEIQKERARELNAINNAPGVETKSSTEETRLECLRHCLNTISADHRDLIINYYQGEKSEKIRNRQRLSERLQIPINTLRMRALRLRDQLELCVENCVNNAE